MFENFSCVKVWSADREKRIVIVTEDYKSLRNSGIVSNNLKQILIKRGVKDGRGTFKLRCRKPLAKKINRQTIIVNKTQHRKRKTK